MIAIEACSPIQSDFSIIKTMSARALTDKARVLPISNPASDSKGWVDRIVSVVPANKKYSDNVQEHWSDIVLSLSEQKSPALEEVTFPLGANGQQKYLENPIVSDNVDELDQDGFSSSVPASEDCKHSRLSEIRNKLGKVIGHSTLAVWLALAQLPLTRSNYAENGDVNQNGVCRNPVVTNLGNGVLFISGGKGLFPAGKRYNPGKVCSLVGRQNCYKRYSTPINVGGCAYSCVISVSRYKDGAGQIFENVQGTCY